MECPHCQGKGAIWDWCLNLRCFTYRPCPGCQQQAAIHCGEGDREYADAVSRMMDEGCPNDEGD